MTKAQKLSTLLLPVPGVTPVTPLIQYGDPL